MLVRLCMVLGPAIVGLALSGRGGNDDGDAVEEGRQARVDGIEYTVLRTRQLNLQIEPDKSYHQGAPPPAERTLLAAFVTACNVTDMPCRTTGDYFVVDNPFETRFEPEPLEADNPFAYGVTEVQPEQCFTGAERIRVDL